MYLVFLKSQSIYFSISVLLETFNKMLNMTFWYYSVDWPTERHNGFFIHFWEHIWFYHFSEDNSTSSINWRFNLLNTYFCIFNYCKPSNSSMLSSSSLQKNKRRLQIFKSFDGFILIKQYLWELKLRVATLDKLWAILCMVLCKSFSTIIWFSCELYHFNVAIYIKVIICLR